VAIIRFLFVTLALSAQLPPVPYGATGPSFSVISPRYVYAGSYQRIREVDFKNFTLHLFHESGRRAFHFKLRSGGFQKREPTYYASVELESVHYLDSEKAGRQHALVLWDLFEAAGSSSRSGIAQVFELANNRLQVTQQIDWDEHFDLRGSYVSFDQRTNSLIIRSAHYLPGDAHCCVSAMDVVIFRWTGTRFTQRTLRTELSEYGKVEGKKLRP
jgi:hypothetical protein